MPTSARANALPLNYRLGEYVIQAVLGHGGFGITYLAQDTKLGAQVAIKEYFPQAYAVRDSGYTIRPRAGGSSAEVDNYRWGLEEFLKEARALAKFKHNHIVRVLRFLEANGTAYMVMEYEAGQSLNDYLSKHGGFLSEPMLLSVFLPILGGLQAVHDAGLLHLDIKPDNIYLRASGQPMLIDFGSARQVRDASDASQKVALTPAYSAIEHYPGKGNQGPWTDVYSMGATLYRCITGKPPTDVIERYNAARQNRPDPLTPATSFERPLYAAHIRHCVDLALRLYPDDRPQSAFAVQQGLMGKDITQEKPTPQSVYRYRSGFIGVSNIAAPDPNAKKRRPRTAGEKLLVFVVFLATIAVVSPKILLDTNQITEDQLFDEIDVLKLRSAVAVKDTIQLIEERVFGKLPAEELEPRPVARPAAAQSRHGPHAASAPFAQTDGPLYTLTGHAASVESVAFLLDGAMLASASSDGVIKFWKVETGELLHTQRGRQSPLVVAASPDGRWLAVPGSDHEIVLLEANELKPHGRLAGHANRVGALAFSADGSRLASASSDNSVLLWDIEHRRPIREFAHNENTMLALAFSPNGRLLVGGDAGGGIKYWDVASGKQLTYSVAHETAITTLSFSPDGQWLASGGSDHFLKLWRTGADIRDRVMAGVPDTLHALQFTADNKWLITGGTHEAVQIWDVDSGTLAHQLYGHNHDIYTIALSADGHWLASGGDDRSVRVWRVDANPPKVADSAAAPAPRAQ